MGIHGRSPLSVSGWLCYAESAPPVFESEDPPSWRLHAHAPRSRAGVSDDSPVSSFFSSENANGIEHVSARSYWKFNPRAFSRAIRKKWRQRTIRSALIRIREIPEQVEDMLSQTASDLSMEVDGGVFLMQGRLRDFSPQGERAARTLEMLPLQFATSVEANLMGAAAVVRQTVSDVTAELGTKDFEDEEIVQELQFIPQKVKDIADEEIPRAVHASLAELQQKLDTALAFLSGSNAVKEKELLQQKLLRQVPAVLEEKITATRLVAEDNIVDAVADLRSEFVPNQWIVEALLRAKSGGVIAGMVASEAAPVEPGTEQQALVAPEPEPEKGAERHEGDEGNGGDEGAENDESVEGDVQLHDPPEDGEHYANPGSARTEGRQFARLVALHDLCTIIQQLFCSLDPRIVKYPWVKAKAMLLVPSFTSAPPECVRVANSDGCCCQERTL